VLVYPADKSFIHVSYPCLGHVSSMVYSATNNTIYIGDVENKQILKLDIDEYKITPFMTSFNQGVRSMAVDKDVLYLIEEHGSNLLWVKESKDDVSWQDLESVTGMSKKFNVATFYLNPEHKKSSCDSATCSHFCFNKDSSGHVCNTNQNEKIFLKASVIGSQPIQNGTGIQFARRECRSFYFF